MRLQRVNRISMKRWRIAGSIFVVFGALLATGARAQTAETLAGVKRVTVEWADTDKGSAAVRDRVLQKLKASSAVEIVGKAPEAQAVLRGKATIWVTGHMSLSTRTKSGEQTVYGGFASMELNGKDGQVLWSYLATPRARGWRTITDDLGDQLAHEFLEALHSKENAERGGESAGGSKSGTETKFALSGAGSTLAAPMYQKWFESFTRLRPELQFQYAAVGSEEGMKRVLAGQTDFAATEVPFREERLHANGRLLEVATMVGAVVPIYNVAGASDGLNLTAEVIAGIFVGKIQRWNAPEIRAINRHARLPDQPIVVIHRSDGSGTTFAWTDYLSKVNSEWRSALGAGTTVKWPVGKGAQGNEGVATAVRNTANSIGYVEFLYALQHELNFAGVRNASGEYVKADLDSVTAAAKTMAIPANGEFGSSITNAAGKHVYPIATLTWLVVPTEGRDGAKTAALRDLLRWVLTNGQRQCEGLGYAPLPGELASRELQAVEGWK